MLCHMICLLRLGAIESLAQGWYGDTDTLSLLKDRTVKDENQFVRREAARLLDEIVGSIERTTSYFNDT